MTIILGIDPGSRLTGYGIIRQSAQQSAEQSAGKGAGHAATKTELSYIASGVIRLEASSMVERLATLYESLGSLLQQYQPEAAAIEKVFVGKSADSALKLGQARGVALLALSQGGLPIAEYSPRTIKQAVTGSGAADKTQVGDMVVRSLSLTGRPSVDAADALAIALCHAYSANLQRVLNGRDLAGAV